MDTPSTPSSANWNADVLFSPSKALAHQAQAKDWAAVDSWLSKKYARPPTFERNEATLQALLTLATANEAADERRALTDRVSKSALQTLRNAGRVNDGEGHAELKGLLSELANDQGLASLANAAVALDAPDVRMETLAGAIADLTSQKFETGQAVQRAGDQVEGLKAERRKADATLKQITSDDFKAPDDLLEQTGEWTRATKQLKAKIYEYDERLTLFRTTARPQMTIEDLTSQTNDLTAQERKLDELQLRLEAFESLPSNPKAARAELEAARDELRKLTKQRDELFERLASDG